MLKKFLTLLISAIMLICVNSIHVNAQEVVNKGIRTEAVTIRRIKAAQLVVSTCYTSDPGNGTDAISGADSNNVFAYLFIVYENVQTITYHSTIRQTGNYRLSNLPNGNIFVKWEYEVDGVRMYF